MAVLSALILLLLPIAAQSQQAPAQPPSQPGEAIQAPGAEDQDGADADISAAGSRRTRSTPTDEPLASPDWAQANFTGFISARKRLKSPDQDLLDRGLRLLTTDDFPPFNYLSEGESPEGYHVDLGRDLCETLSVACTLKIVPFAEIPQLLANGEADAAIAGVSNHPKLQDMLSFSDVYLQRPGRFVRQKDKFLQISAHGLDNLPVAVRGGTAHEAYLKTYFPAVNRVPVTDVEDARQLLTEGKVTAIFGDAFNLLPLVSEANSPLIFASKPFYDNFFFGDGMTIAVGAGQLEMKNLINYGLLKLTQKGRMAELYARHFPMDIYATY